MLHAIETQKSLQIDWFLCETTVLLCPLTILSREKQFFPQIGNVQDARREMTKTKEQLEEEKKISLSIRIKPLDLDGMDSDMLRSKANELWDTIVRLETEKYDLEERQRRQEYDVSANFQRAPDFLDRKMKLKFSNSRAKIC